MIIEIRKPELESLICDRMENGEFQNDEDILILALKSSPIMERHSVAQRKPKKAFAQFLL